MTMTQCSTTPAPEADLPDPRDGSLQPELARPRPLSAATLVWFVGVASISLFVAAGTVEIGSGPFQGYRIAVLDSWLDFLGDLPTVARPDLLHALVVALLAIVAIGSAIALWLALAPDDPIAGDSDDDRTPS